MVDPAQRIYERLLVLRCQSGDETAFGELVVRYAIRLRLFLHKLIGEGAEDALQDVWLSAWRTIGQLKDASAFPAWIYRIARDRAFAELRKRGQVGHAIIEDELASQEEDAAFSPEEVAQVHAALDRLVPEHREVLLLRFVESMSYDEIARVVGCAVGTVRSRVHYAKIALRKQIERMERHERERTGKGAASL